MRHRIERKMNVASGTNRIFPFLPSIGCPGLKTKGQREGETPKHKPDHRKGKKEDKGLAWARLSLSSLSLFFF